MEKDKEGRGNIINPIYKCYYFVGAIIIAIFLGLLTVDELWPREFLEEEKYYYYNLAKNLWNNGLKSIAKEIKDIKNNCLYIEPFDENDKTVYIELYEISDNIITISFCKKGEIVYFFTEENEPTTMYKTKNKPVFFCICIGSSLSMFFLVLYLAYMLCFIVEMHLSETTN